GPVRDDGVPLVARRALARPVGDGWIAIVEPPENVGALPLLLRPREGVGEAAAPPPSDPERGTRYVSRTKYRGASASDPVRRLDEEHVVRPVAEQRSRVAAELEVAVRIAPRALLRPHEEHRRAGAVLPTQHGRA